MELDRRLFDGKVQSSIVYPKFFPLASHGRVVNLGCGLGPQAVVYKNSFKEMVGVDLSSERLRMSEVLLREAGVMNYKTVCAPVEATGLPSESFERALAIDIIEHLRSPGALLLEAHRLLKPGGELLVSVPAMHDHYVHGIKRLGRLLGKKTKELPAGHLDAHNSSLSLREWEEVIRHSPFTIVKTRATTLFPPLHLYGVPKFWFTNPCVHAIDSFLCELPFLKRFGQSSLMILKKAYNTFSPPLAMSPAFGKTTVSNRMH